MKKTLAILLIVALSIAPIVSYAAATAHIDSVEYKAGSLTGIVSVHGGKCEAVCTLFFPGNWYFQISAPIEADGSFSLFVGIPCECITIAIKEVGTGKVLDAAMLLF